MASRLRQSTATPAPSRRSTANATPGRALGTQLPHYEVPEFSLNPAAQRHLYALLQDAKLKKLEKYFEDASKSVTEAAIEVNDRLQECEKDSNSRKRKQGDDAEEAETGQEVEQNLEELRDKVDRMTQRMDESMRKIIDGQHAVQYMKDSITATADDIRTNASTQASVQHGRSQVRRRRSSASGDEDDEDEYQAFQPTDPTAATQQPRSAVDTFRARVADKKTQYQAHTRHDRYAENESYSNFRHAVYDARNPDDDEHPMPGPETWFPEGDIPAPGITARPTANADDEDDDIAVARVTISTKCPLTLQEFKDPLSSKKCPHSFENSAIMEMIRMSNTRVGQERAVLCPVGGCREQLTKNDLHRDAVLLRKIKRMQRAQEVEEEEDDDDLDGHGATQRNATMIDSGDEVDDAEEDGTQVKEDSE